MSKKLAESLDKLVLDVKFGRGAFMQKREDAQALADAMVAVGNGAGVETHALLNPMDQPLGRAAGNALEVAECVEVMQGGGPDDLIELTLQLAAKLVPSPRDDLRRRLGDGSAWRKFVAMVEAQGGDARALEKIREVHRAPVITDLPATRDGRIGKLDALAVGRLCVELGGGRTRAGDNVDFSVGVECLKKTGELVAKGETVLRVHSRTPIDPDSVSAAVFDIVSG
jgi:thymidine phosphorylase